MERIFNENKIAVSLLSVTVAMACSGGGKKNSSAPYSPPAAAAIPAPLGGDGGKTGDQITPPGGPVNVAPTIIPVPRGCVQGTVVNGLTGEKIDIESSKESFFVLIRDAKMRASSVAQEGDAELKGEYFICDIPLDETYLIFAHLTGFQPFQSVITVASTISERASTQADNDITIADPMTLANIRLFPVGVNTQDLTFHVVHNGAPVVGATVRLEPDSANVFSLGGFLVPQDPRLTAQNEVTNSEGRVVFSKDSLVLGGSYQYKVVPKASDDLEIKTGSLRLGVGDASADAMTSYRVTVEMVDAGNTLKLVSCNSEETSFLPGGTLSLVFNRDVKLVFLDTLDATVLLPGNAVLRTTIPGNNASETVSSSVTKNVVVLTPNWVTSPTVALAKDITITYAGINVRATDGLDMTLSITGACAGPHRLYELGTL